MKIQVGIYDNVGAGYSVKVTEVIRVIGKPIYANMYFTNNKHHGKSHFGMEGEYLQEFLKGSILRYKQN